MTRVLTIPFLRALQFLPIEDESYLCLLCLRDSTERIVMLYFNYIKLRQEISRDTPAVLIGMLMVLQEKHHGLQEKLLQYYPDNMATGKWHDRMSRMNSLGISVKTAGNLFSRSA